LKALLPTVGIRHQEPGSSSPVTLNLAPGKHHRKAKQSSKTRETTKSGFIIFPLLDFDEIIEPRLTMDIKPSVGQTT
jgi:hypothetical protein